jgi:hypothetical protein
MVYGETCPVQRVAQYSQTLTFHSQSIVPGPVVEQVPHVLLPGKDDR